MTREIDPTLGTGLSFLCVRSTNRKVAQIDIKRITFVAEHAEMAALRASNWEQILIAAAVKAVVFQAVFRDPRWSEHGIIRRIRKL